MKVDELARAKELAKQREQREVYYEARLTVFVKGYAPSRAAFDDEIDRLLDEWQLDSETTKTNLTWDDVEVDYIFASESEANR